MKIVFVFILVRDHIPLKEGLRQTNVSVSAKFPDEIPDHIPLQEGLFQCTIFGVIWGRQAVAGIRMVIEAVKRDIGSDPVSRFTASFPLLRCLLSVASLPFRCYEGSDPMCHRAKRGWHIGSDPCRFLSLPAASCRSLPLPAAPCRSLPLPAAPCRSLPLPVTSCRFLVATQGALSCSVRHGV